mmetsp:Transcript_21382/g.38738  ORF Transcript_21382/g.38738 Transcript_21382/m.38738 type:complete len:309 (-) Transcript_21382:624-1550(-)
MLSPSTGAVRRNAAATRASLVKSAAPREGNRNASTDATRPAATPVVKSSRLAPRRGSPVLRSSARMPGRNTWDVMPTESPTGHQKKKLRRSTWWAASATDPSLPTDMAMPLYTTDFPRMVKKTGAAYLTNRRNLWTDGTTTSGVAAEFFLDRFRLRFILPNRNDVATMSAQSVPMAAPVIPIVVFLTNVKVPMTFKTKAIPTDIRGPRVSFSASAAALATLAIITKGCPNARTSAYFNAEGTTEALASPAIRIRIGLPANSTSPPKKAPLQSAKKRASLTIRSASESSPLAMAEATRLVAAVAMKKNK